MKRKKLKTCCSVWHAYRDAYIEISYRLAQKPSLITKDDEEAFEAYRKIIAYGRTYHKYSKKDASSPVAKTRTDWELYRVAYQDALTLYDRLNLIENIGDCFVEIAYYSQLQIDLMMAFQDILKYSCDKRLGSFNRLKVRNYISRLKGVMNFYNRSRK